THLLAQRREGLRRTRHVPGPDRSAGLRRLDRRLTFRGGTRMGIALHLDHPEVHLRALVVGIDRERFAPLCDRLVGVPEREQCHPEQHPRNDVPWIRLTSGRIMLASEGEVADVAVERAEASLKIGETRT